MAPPLFYDLTLPEVQAHLVEMGLPSYRAGQLWHGIYLSLIPTLAGISNLPADLRKDLEETFSFSSLTPSISKSSEDRLTLKTLFKLADNSAIETVLMKYDQRRTLCISSQVGCAMGCAFCATGQMGFIRNLSCGEIVEQVVFFARLLRNDNQTLSNIVIMGMGEPFHNFQATIRAIDILNDSKGMGIGERRFTISTVGLVPMIKQFSTLKRQINLAISLHAANDELRSRLLPINKKYPLSELIKSVREYIEMTGRRVSFEWALIQDVNDTTKHADELVKLVKGLMCHVNIIPLNPTRAYSGTPSPRVRAQDFQAVLQKSNIPCTIRLRRGIEIQAGCGQLATLQKQT